MKISRISKNLPALALTLALLLCSCGAGDDGTPNVTGGADPSSDGSDNAIETEAVETVDEAYVCDVPAPDMEGRTFTFLLYGDGDPVNWSEVDIIRDEMIGEVINDSIIIRNRDVEEQCNVVIDGIYSLTAGSTLQKCVQSGDTTYDAVFLQMAAAGSAAKSGYCTAWNDVPNVDLTKGYWDQSIVEDMSVGGKIYMTTGDISTIDNQATWIMMFNKDMAKEYNIESPYTYALDGTWTIDRFEPMIKDLTTDLDGNGVMDKLDRYGMSTTADTVYGLFYSCGLTLVSKDADDLPVFNLDVNKVSRIFEKSATIMSEENTLVSGRIKSTSDAIGDIRAAFQEDRAMFYCEVMYHVANLRQMETDFGIIPMPKYDEAQENYVTFVNPASTVLLIPRTNSDLETTGALLENFAYASYNRVTPAYYDTALVGKYTRDEESKEMLDLLLVNRTYDLGLIYGWSSFLSQYNTMVISGNDTLSSLIASSSEKINTELDKFVSDFTSNNG